MWSAMFEGESMEDEAKWSPTKTLQDYHSVHAFEYMISGAGTLDIEVYTSISGEVWISNGVSPGICEWEFSYLYTAEGENTAAAAQDTITANEAAPVTTDGLVITPAAGMDLPGATDICIHGKLRRLSAGGTDTIAGTVELHGVALWYTSNKLGETTE